MPTCQCPACQAQFQAAADRGAFTACPECQFKVRVPELRQEPSGAPVPGMLTHECSNCRLKFQVPKDKASATQRCPECNETVAIGGKARRRSRSRRIVLALVFLLATCLVLVQIFGRKSPAKRSATNLHVFGNDSELYLFFQVDTFRQGEGPIHLAHEFFVARYDGEAWRDTQPIASSDPYILHENFCSLCRYADRFVAIGHEKGQSYYVFNELRSEFYLLRRSDPVVQALQPRVGKDPGQYQRIADSLTHESGWEVLYRRRWTFSEETTQFAWNGNEYVILSSVDQQNKVKVWIEPREKDRMKPQTLIEFDKLAPEK
jgi:hypothetical protein